MRAPAMGRDLQGAPPMTATKRSLPSRPAGRAPEGKAGDGAARREGQAEPEVVQPGRVPTPGAKGSFQEKIAGAGDDGAIEVRSLERNVKPLSLASGELEVRRWTSVRDEELERREHSVHQASSVTSGSATSAPTAAKAPAHPHTTATPAPSAQAGMRAGLLLGEPPALTTRAAIADAIYRTVGRAGSLMQAPGNRNFTLERSFGPGEVFAPRAVTVPLPQGHATSHQADVAVEMENGALLVVDVFASLSGVADLKAMAFDALQLRRLNRCFVVLVLVRSASGGLPQGQVEAIGHGYDVVFGVDEAKMHNVASYNALVERIKAWCRAAANV